jgi:hypothetical protein
LFLVFYCRLQFSDLAEDADRVSIEYAAKEHIGWVVDCLGHEVARWSRIVWPSNREITEIVDGGVNHRPAIVSFEPLVRPD